MPKDETWKNAGLSVEDRRDIEDAITRTGGIAEVILFGSRALGTYRPGSDVDLAIRCERGVDPGHVVSELSTLLNEETSLPYRFDVIALEQLVHEGLKEHVRGFGKRLYVSGRRENPTD